MLLSLDILIDFLTLVRLFKYSNDPIHVRYSSDLRDSKDLEDLNVLSASNHPKGLKVLEELGDPKFSKVTLCYRFL